MKDKKKWVIGILCTLVCIMAVGYAVLAQQLNITGTSSIDSTWKVEITNIQESEVVGKAVSKITPSYTSTTANFSVGLTQPGDSITYEVEISNLGTLKAKVDSINVVMDENDAIKYTTSGVSNGDKLGVGEKATLTIKVEYDSNVTSQPAVTTKDITVTINYVQDLDEGNTTTTYQTYSIGDTVTFAGSNWYVIKNSSGEEDYVTLMKEQVLTHDELGEYGANYTCVGGENSWGCTSTTNGVQVDLDTMAYYWNDTCYNHSIYYNEGVYLGCAGHNDYEGSKVKEMLENQYLPTLGSDNLKEVDGYKVRLITLEELQSHLGISTEITVSWYDYDAENTPVWVNQNFKGDNYSGGYWTMTPDSKTDCSFGNACIVVVDNTAVYATGIANEKTYGVRPVINLLKSSI